MKKLLTFFLSVMAMASFSDLVFAQPATARWPLLTDGSVQNSGQIVGTPQFITSNLVYGSYASPGTNFYTQRIKMPTWPVNQLTQLDSVYIQFVASPQTSYNMKIDSVVLSIGAVSTKDMMANLYYSTDSTFTTKTQVSYTTSAGTRSGNPLLSSSKLDTVSFMANIMVNEGQSFYFRVYPWVDSSSSVSGKYIALQNVVVYATAIPIPVSAYALWPLSSKTEVPVISGLINASNVTFNGDLEHYGYNSNGDRWMSLTGAWPQETSPNFTRYAQVTVSPKTGGTFYPSNLKFNMIQEYSKNLRMAIYYSHDTSFANKTFIADTSVPASVTSYSYSLKDTVLTGDTLYFRFYPYDITGDPAYKLIDVDSIEISGATTGLAILAPTVSTTNASYISTTFLTTGGNVTSDGGGAVTAKGVCWDTVANPTIANHFTNDGNGIGSYISSLTGLIPGKTYHIRAYATNAGGTNYGNEIVVTTLDSILVPTVITNSITNILAVTATGGGNVVNWGGAPVTAKGVCWNTSGNPTINDNKTVDGTDIGSFSSAITGLAGGTLYHVRAYATNSAGTGYGADSTFTTQNVAPDTTVVVAQDGSGNYTTVQQAFNAVPANYTGHWTIFVKKGSYHEKDTLASNKMNVILEGEDRDSTIIWNNDYGDKYGSGNPGTSGTFTVTIEANDFIAKNITIQNTYSPQPGVSGTQAVALRVNGDRQQYINCNLLGYQDTYYTWGGRGAGRIYMKNCLIQGTVDFIFGRDIVVFDSCTIHEIRNGGTLTAGSTDATSLFGYVFRNCTIKADSIGYDSVAITSFDLGRPWQSSPRTVFMQCYEPANLDPAGWLAWNVTPALYAEYKCFGPGSNSSKRVSFSKQLSDAEAAQYSLTNIFARNSASSPLILTDWMPSYASSSDNIPIVTNVKEESSIIPKSVTLSQNYPNPFNPSTQIRYTVPKESFVTLEVFNILGQKVATLVNQNQKVGEYTVNFDASHLSSGVYIYRLSTSNSTLAKKMLLLK
jgi:pectinesterase